MRELEFHEAANIFPLDEEHIGDLAHDIRQRGQQVAIEVLDGKILDGRRRYLACNKAAISPRFIEVDVADPVAYVVSLNLHRRHLSAAQRAMCAGRATALQKKYADEAKERQRQHGNTAPGRNKSLVERVPQVIADGSRARDKVGEMFGVSGRTVADAVRVIRDGTPELAKAVDEGRMGVSTAAELTSEPEETQRHAAQFIPDGRPRARRYKPGSNGAGESTQERSKHKEDNEEIKVQGVGVFKAHEAINHLKEIPRNDALRKRGFQIVTDWIRHNQ